VSLDKPQQAEPVSGVDALVAFFRGGEKPRDRFRVGMEHEKIGLLSGTSQPIPYAGERGIGELMRRLQRFDYQPLLEAGQPIAAMQGDLGITLEPGGQLELSGRPFCCSHDLDKELRRHIAIVHALGAELGQSWLGVGYRPFGTVADAEWMPKGRYERMRAYLSQRGALALDMMTMTGTVQANFDFSDEADMARKVRVGNSISPLVTALFANSPIREARDSGFLTFRTEVWRQVDPARCGLLEAAFRPNFGYRAYTEWALDVPMIFLRRGNEYRDPNGATFRRFLAEGVGGERATMSDWEDHLSTLFPEIRLKKIVEVRGADAGTVDMCVALPALWKGIFYTADALDAADRLIQATFPERVQWIQDVSHQALKAKIAGRSVIDLGRELVAISTAGLRSQPSCGPDEGRFLDPLRQILEDGRTPAEIALAKLKGEYAGDAKKLLDHWRIA
jgi:glutamate--cysteine ligase